MAPAAGRSIRITVAAARSITCALVLALTGGGCGRPADSATEITMRCKISPQPMRVGSSEVALELMGTKPVTGARIQMEGDMAHPGMAPVFSEARESHAGFYKGQLDFSMPGDWVVLMHIQLADGRKLERQVEVKGVQPNEGR